MRLRRTLLISFLVSLACALPAAAWDAGLSYTVSPSPLYNWSWNPAIDGMGVAFDLRLGPPALYAQVGLQPRVGGIGSEILLPLGAGRTLWHNQSQRIDAAAGAILGIELFYPAPFLTVGAYAGAAWSWFWNPHWGLTGGISLRYLTSPAYSARIAPYQVVDLPISIGLRYRAGR